MVAAADGGEKAAVVAPSPPKSWPVEVCELYEPVRKLGEGGFAAVMLAKRRKRSKKNSSSTDGSSTEYVAIKVVASKEVSKQEIGYAHREIEILAELNHQNVMRLVDHWEPPLKDAAASSSNAVAVMALSFADGPTVHDLIMRGGALGTVFSRVVAAQLVDALAYLHSRAVVYRDVKPDNIIVTGACPTTQDEIWDDLEAPSCPDWKHLISKWHVTLVDFGFARALTPEDMGTQVMNGSSRTRTLDSSTGSLGQSVSRRLFRTMSALGNRAYAAPEVQKGVQKNLNLSNHPYSRHSSVDVTKTLAEHISMYGLTADAYSLGNTLIHMLTGIRPDQNADEIIAAENSPIVLLCRFLCNLGRSSNTEGGGDEGGPGRKVKHRSFSDIPADVKRLICGLTHRNPRERTSVRAARKFPWIDDVLVDRGLPWVRLDKIEYLQFVMEKKNKGHTDKVEGAPQPVVASEGQDEIIEETVDV